MGQRFVTGEGIVQRDRNIDNNIPSNRETPFSNDFWKTASVSVALRFTVKKIERTDDSSSSDSLRSKEKISPRIMEKFCVNDHHPTKVLKARLK